jgi:enolase
MTEIIAVDAWEVLDSRGNPTVRVAVETSDARGVFTVPAGASTGTHEVTERRDGGKRFGGKGVLNAVHAVQEDLAPAVVGREVTDQAGIDAVLVECDGTSDLSRIGANAVLGVSGAVAHAASAVRGEPLYASLADGSPGRIPLPMVNVLSGGLHATGGIEIQDFLIVPVGARTYPEALETVWAVREAIRERIVAAGHRPLVADEGGFAPPLSSIDEAFDLLEAGVRDAGFEPARDEVAFAVDVAATHFYDDDADRYRLDSVNRRLDRDEMSDLVTDWTERYPIVSIEDPLAEDDWDGFADLVDRLDPMVQVLGDDLLVTNIARLEQAIERDAATAILVKPNQTGTLTRTLDVLETARESGFATVVSARSGETCDATIADLAVAHNVGQIKIGSLARSERLSKYNRLLELDHRTDTDLDYAGSQWSPSL